MNLNSKYMMKRKLRAFICFNQKKELMEDFWKYFLKITCKRK